MLPQELLEKKNNRQPALLLSSQLMELHESSEDQAIGESL